MPFWMRLNVAGRKLNLELKARKRQRLRFQSGNGDGASVPAVGRGNGWLLELLSPARFRASVAFVFQLPETILVFVGFGLEPARLTALFVARRNVLGRRAAREQRGQRGEKKKGSGHDSPDARTLR